MKILIGSKNPVKINATKKAFSKYFGNNIEVIGINVDSGVSDQPIGNDTFEGAKNRALNLKKIDTADFFVGIEGGIKNIYSRWFSFGAVCIIDDSGKISFATSFLFELPKTIIEELLKGKELGIVMDNIVGDHNIKQKGGAIDFFTKGVINREKLYVDGIISALIPFLNKDLFD